MTTHSSLRGLLLGSLSILALAACSKEEATSDTSQTPAAPEVSSKEAGPSLADVETFLSETEAELDELFARSAQVSWTYATDITDEHAAAMAEVDAEVTKKLVDLANATKKFKDMDLPDDMQRQIDVLRGGITIPAPSTEGAAERLANINTGLSSAYSKGKITIDGEEVPQNETELLMRSLDDADKLEEVWTKWRAATKGMRDDYAEMVAISNEGARELGYADTGAMWRSGYDMDPDDFVAETDRLWEQVKPLYVQLQCHVKYKLNEKYGDEVVPLDQPIRADLLGNMWAQSWGALYDDVKPDNFPEATSVDLDKLLVDAGFTEIKMVETGEDFFSSLGFAPLPNTFWERSMIVKPEGKEVVCHASAWNLDNKEDIRIKMCTNIDGDDFITIHHELGHNYYQRAYNKQPLLLRGGANDGFHEAIGDMVALSITPEYLQQIGLLAAEDVPGPEGDLELLMRQALDKIAFMPFGLLMDKWRWQVFSGELTPETYNDGWWALRKQYQGIRPPNERPADAFDPGSKYHIPNNVPYTRYFLAHILQFQFYKTACEKIGWEGPLHRCSFYGAADEVGGDLNAMLEMGAAQPWQDTLELFTGSPEMDGSAVVSYFQPLMEFLEEENKDRQCGW